MTVNFIYIKQPSDKAVEDALKWTSADLNETKVIESLDLLPKALAASVETGDAIVIIGGWPDVPGLVARSVGFDTCVKSVNGVNADLPENSKCFATDGKNVDCCAIETSEQSIVMIKDSELFSSTVLPFLVGKFRLELTLTGQASEKYEQKTVEMPIINARNVGVAASNDKIKAPLTDNKPTKLLNHEVEVYGEGVDASLESVAKNKRSKRPIAVFATLIACLGVLVASLYFFLPSQAEDVGAFYNSASEDVYSSDLYSSDIYSSDFNSTDFNSSDFNSSDSNSVDSASGSTSTSSGVSDSSASYDSSAITSSQTGNSSAVNKQAATLNASSSASKPSASAVTSSASASGAATTSSSSTATVPSSSASQSSSASKTPAVADNLSFNAPTSFTVKDSATGKTVSGSATEIVSQIVEIEIGSSAPNEAIKAQAVASYTWLTYTTKNGAVPTVHMKKASPNVISAVESVEGQMLTYNGQPINATYFSTSAGHTADSADIWGGDLPYLKSVDSSYDTAGKYYSTTSSFPASSIATWVKEDYGIDLTGVPKDQWFTVTYDENNTYAESVNIGGSKTVKGTDINNKLLKSSRTGSSYLRSSAYTINYDASTDKFIFSVKGNGHGVGMSQIGAIEMAKQGKTYDEILLHYYTGVTLAK